MKAKKPDIFLGITLCMAVLAAVLCIVILFVNKSGKQGSNTPETTTVAPVETGDTADTGDSGEAPIGSSENPVDTTPDVDPADLKAIDEAGLKAALDDALSGLTSEWQVMVTDPVKGSRVSSAVNCKVDDWMTANRMAQVFIMGTAFQQVQDGTLTEDAILDDVTAMITQNNTEAADRLTELLGAGDAAKGRENVKAFAVANETQLGFNRPLTGSADKKNYVTAQKTAVILDKICRGELVSKAASAKMLELLLTPTDNLEIDASGLTGDNLRYGFICDVEEKTCICAMGVVKLPNRSFVISVVCNKPVTTDGAKKKIAEILNLTLPYFQD